MVTQTSCPQLLILSLILLIHVRWFQHHMDFSRTKLQNRVGRCQSRFLIQVELDCVNGLIGINRLVRNWVLSCKPISDHRILSIDNNGKSIYIKRGSEIRMGAYTNGTMGTMGLFELVSLCKHPIFCTWALCGMHF